MSLKNELLELIFAAGLVEDFISYLRSKEVEIEEISSLYDIDEELLLEYVKKRRLVEGFEDDMTEDLQSEPDFEPKRLRPKTPPRRE